MSTRDEDIPFIKAGLAGHYAHVKKLNGDEVLIVGEQSNTGNQKVTLAVNIKGSSQTIIELSRDEAFAVMAGLFRQLSRPYVHAASASPDASAATTGDASN